MGLWASDLFFTQRLSRPRRGSWPGWQGWAQSQAFSSILLSVQVKWPTSGRIIPRWNSLGFGSMCGDSLPRISLLLWSIIHSFCRYLLCEVLYFWPHFVENRLEMNLCWWSTIARHHAVPGGTQSIRFHFCWGIVLLGKVMFLRFLWAKYGCPLF